MGKIIKAEYAEYDNYESTLEIPENPEERAALKRQVEDKLEAEILACMKEIGLA